jgi:hypothetical protein
MSTEKVSATIDRELLAEVRSRVGRRGLSAFVNQAVAEKLQRERVIEFLDELEAEVGRPSEAMRQAAEKKLAKVLGGRWSV